MRLYEGDPGRIATILPGREYSPDRPLLHFARRILTDRGWTVRTHEWSADAAQDPAIAAREAARALDQVDRSALHLVVGKSLGTLALPAAVDRALPGVWFSPLLREERVRLAAAAVLEPTLLVGGPHDPQWEGELARAGRSQVHEVKDADADLEIPGDVRQSLRALDRVMRRVEDFVEGMTR